jgi:Flp pilus assembly protein TadD
VFYVSSVVGFKRDFHSVCARLAACVLIAAAASSWGAAAYAQATKEAQIESRPGAVSLPPTEQSEIARLLREKQLPAALARADAFLQKNPRDAQVRFLRGVILADSGRTPDAVATFEALIQDFPELPESYNNLAVIHAGQGRLEQARALLQRALEAQPNYVTARENLGDLHVALAADAYRQASALDPNNATLKSKLALAREIGTKLQAVR